MLIIKNRLPTDQFQAILRMLAVLGSWSRPWHPWTREHTEYLTAS